MPDLTDEPKAGSVFCQHCDNPNDVSNKFCEFCGMEIDHEAVFDPSKKLRQHAGIDTGGQFWLTTPPTGHVKLDNPRKSKTEPFQCQGSSVSLDGKKVGFDCPSCGVANVVCSTEFRDSATLKCHACQAEVEYPGWTDMNRTGWHMLWMIPNLLLGIFIGPFALIVIGVVLGLNWLIVVGAIVFTAVQSIYTADFRSSGGRKITRRPIKTPQTDEQAQAAINRKSTFTRPAAESTPDEHLHPSSAFPDFFVSGSLFNPKSWKVAYDCPECKTRNDIHLQNMDRLAELNCCKCNREFNYPGWMLLAAVRDKRRKYNIFMLLVTMAIGGVAMVVSIPGLIQFGTFCAMILLLIYFTSGLAGSWSSRLTPYQPSGDQ